MKRGIVWQSAAVTCLLLPCSLGQATLVGGYYYEHSIKPEHTPYPEQTRFELFYGPYHDGAIVGPVEYYPEWGPLFRVFFTAEDTGTTYLGDAGDAFDVAVDSLTNGSRDSYSWMFAHHGLGGAETGLWFADLHTDSHNITSYYGGSNGIDFEGFTIESIAFTVTDFQPYHGAFKIEVFGEPVPEPSTILIIAFGAGIIRMTRRR